MNGNLSFLISSRIHTAAALETDLKKTMLTRVTNHHLIDTALRAVDSISEFSFQIPSRHALRALGLITKNKTSYNGDFNAAKVLLSVGLIEPKPEGQHGEYQVRGAFFRDNF